MAAVCVFCGSSRSLPAAYTELAAEMGGALARSGHLVVSGGSVDGMMGAVAAAARAAGGRTLGITPESMAGKELVDADSDELVVVSDLIERKREMLARSDAFVALPGGLGTLDELFEAWTQRMVGHHRKPIVVLNVDGFHDGLVDWLRGLVKAGFVSESALDDVIVASSVDEAVAALD